MSDVSPHWSRDQLGRASLAKNVSDLIETMASGGVFGIDGPFGHGKTFFVEGLAEDLRKRDLTVVRFDAWKADLAPQPLFLFVAETLSQLEAQGLAVAGKADLAKKIGQLTSAVARVGLKTLLRAGDDDLDKIAEPFLAEVDRLDFTRKGAAADAVGLADQVEAARSSFSAAVQALIVGDGRKLPLVVVIDELDRARPDFAIEFLEALKFIFATENVVFCIAVDRPNLSESIRAKFGSNYNVSQYLARIFSFWITLQNPILNVSFLTSQISQEAISDGGLIKTEDFRTGLPDLARFGVVGLAAMSSNLRSIQRCAERASICVRLCKGNQWAGLIGFLSGLSVSDPSFLKEYCLPGQRRLGSHFMEKLAPWFQYTRTEWDRAALVACATPPEEMRAGEPFVVQYGSQRIFENAIQIANEFQRVNIMARSPANFLFERIGWVLG